MSDLIKPMLAVCLCLLISEPSSAASEDSQEERRPVATHPLHPDLDNEIKIEAAAVDFFSDGSRRFRFEISLDPGESESFISFVDMGRKTYSTRRVPQTYIPLVWPSFQNPSPLQVNRNQGPDPIGPPGTNGSCDYRAVGLIIHFDPVFIELAITSGTMEWTHDFVSNCLSMGITRNFCFATPETPVPPPLGPTHWFTDSCTGLKRTIDLQHLQKTTAGRYHNWDWHNPNIQTWVQHYVQIDARTGPTTFVMSHLDGGEDALIIFAVTEIGLTELRCE